jgi:Domain of unknown function (DUF4157)
MRRVLQRCGPVPCNCPEGEDGTLLQRTADESSHAEHRGVPQVVHQVLRSPGQPLSNDTRQYYEPLFGQDFSRVRVHVGPMAAESARAVNARAFTVGTDIVLGGVTRPEATARDKWVMAHELTHVIQQDGGRPAHAELTLGEAGSPAEREADVAAAHVARGDAVVVRGRRSARVVRRQLSCPELISPADATVVSGIGIPAHDAIEEYFRDVVGSNFWHHEIPGSSSRPVRTEDRDERRRRSRRGIEQVDPQVIGGRAGPGYPDLGLRDARTLEVAEVKPAILSYGPTGGLVEGIGQLAKYVLKGNAPENRDWRAAQRPRIDLVSPMQTSRVTWPSSLTTAGGRKIAVGWCLPGLVGYRPLSAEEAETILCGVSDQKAIDKFLNVALDGALGAVDRFIDSSVDQLLTRRIQTMSIREGLALLGRYGRDLLQDFLTSQLGPGGEAVLETTIRGVIGAPGMELVEALAGGLTSDQLIDGAALLIEQQIGPQFEALLRAAALQLKTRLLTDVRRYLKDRLRTYVQESLAAVCAAAAVGATISVAQVLKRFTQDLGKRFGEAIVEVALALAAELAREVAKGIAYAVLIAIAIVAVIFFLPEILAALAVVGEFTLAAGAALAALGPRLAPLLQQLVQIVLGSVPTLEAAL